MYVEDSVHHILKFYYPKAGISFVGNYREFTERTNYNSNNDMSDGPHTGGARYNGVYTTHLDSACTTGSYAAFLAKSDCNVDASNSHHSLGNSPGRGNSYIGNSPCWFYAGQDMSSITSITTCAAGDKAYWGNYTTGALSGTIRLLI